MAISFGFKLNSNLKQFHKQCNSFDPHIKFEQTVSPTTIPFLDAQVSLTGDRLSTDLYTKPTDTHQYLDWTSCYPRHTKAAIPYSLALRLRRICSSSNSFEMRARQLHNILLARGHKNKLIKESNTKVRRITRGDVLKMCDERPATNRVPLVATYNPALPDLRKIVKDHQAILSTSTRCKEIFQEPVLIAYRKGKTLAQMLSSNRLPLATSHVLSPIHSQPQPSRDNGIPDPTETSCQICGKSFITNRGLKIHVTHKHKTNRSYSKKHPGFWPCKVDPRCGCCKN